jgi:hypothetical protein
MRQKHIKYGEGQWFAVPLRKGGYALGIIVRGSYKSKGGLGYFFGPKYAEIPDDKATWEKDPRVTVLITRFSDLGIINGSWPLIQSTRPFSPEEWPIPKFGLEISLMPGKGYIREYKQKATGEWVLHKETLVEVKDIVNLPKDSFLGGGAIEIKLTNLLDDL